MSPVEHESERLRLRQWRESDVAALHAFYCDPLSVQIYGGPVSLDDAWRRIALILGHFEIRGYGLWALEEKSGGAFVGFGGLWFPHGWSDVEVGYGIAPEHRGKGFATEAAAAARDYGYGRLGLDRVVSYIQPDNRASIRVAEKLGARPSGSFLMKDLPHTVYLHTNTEIKGAKTWP
jgi:RimJ/RimL family protein N-acetyltransferase